MDKPEIKTRFQHLKAWAGPVFVLVMLIAALWFLHLELKEYSLREFREALLDIPVWKLALAIVLTLANYAILVCYDWLGIWYIRHPMKFGRVALASFLGYSVGNNFGLLFGGSTIRYRLYSTWGLSAAEIVTLLFILAITFWIGLFALSGVVFLIAPLDIPEAVSLPMKTTRPLGIILTVLAIAYLAVSFIGKPLKIWKKEFQPPPFGLSVMQFIVAAIDLLVAAAIVYVLLPESIEISYFKFVGIFLLAQVAVFVTQVPGGLGVLELCLITLLAPSPEAEPELFASLMAYRLIFYLTPMVIGIGMLGAHEILTQREHLKKAFSFLGVWTPDIAPRIAALIVFFAGVCMLFGAALPVEANRMELLNQYLPLWFIELSYFLCGIIGVLLLLLSRGLYRRIAMAWVFTLPALGAAIFFVLTGSLGYLQVLILLTALFVVAPVGHYFHRRGKLLTDQIAYHWLIAIAVVLIIATWLYWFAYKQRGALSFDLLQFALHADAPRSLRAILGALVAAAGFYIVRILQISIGRPETTTHRELIVASNIVAGANETIAQVALQGDKRFLFNEAETAFVMYAESGKSSIALGNPIGPSEDAFQLAWDFREMCQIQSYWPVFFLVDDRFAALYQEMNLSLFHVGDLALVDLRDGMDPAQGPPSMMQARESMDERGSEFRVLEDPSSIEAVLPDLERINDAWQKDRGGATLKFSTSFFNAEAIKRNPVALVEQEGRIVAFATLWLGADMEEIAVGMIRYLPETAANILDYILLEA
ncbi:MAG: phosphatidylglycerol lysyltransferase domain-containing protein, partial [Pirellulaceae bacterium]